MRKFFFIIPSIITFNAYSANETIKLGRPNIIGTGCPLSSVTATLASDKSAITIIFDKFLIEAGRSAGKIFESKNCKITLPVFAPINYRVSFVNVDYSGYFDLKKGAIGEINNQYIIAGHLPFEDKKSFQGPYQGNFIHSSGLGSEVWSNCGASFHLNISTNLYIKSNLQMEDVIGGLDSIDASGQVMKFNFKIEKCR